MGIAAGNGYATENTSSERKVETVKQAQMRKLLRRDAGTSTDHRWRKILRRCAIATRFDQNHKPNEQRHVIITNIDRKSVV